MKPIYLFAIFTCLISANVLGQDSETEISYKVIKETINIISTEDKWTQEGEFGDECMSERDQYTLGCALMHAQLKVRGEHKGRACEMEAIRISILFNYFNRLEFHPIFGFNRNSNTTHADVISLLEKVLHKFDK